MHYLKVAGMPKKFTDYPDAFYIFNKIIFWILVDFYFFKQKLLTKVLL